MYQIYITLETQICTMIIKYTHLNKGLHLSIIPPPLTTNKCPLDHFCNLCFDPVSLLHVVGAGSIQSFRTLFIASCCCSINSMLPKIIKLIFENVSERCLTKGNQLNFGLYRSLQ